MEQSRDTGERIITKGRQTMTEEDKTREEVTGEERGCEKRGGNVAYVVSYCWQSLLKNA